MLRKNRKKKFWVTLFRQIGKAILPQFLNQNPNASITVNAGEVIRLANFHTDNSDAKKFRLSMHYLDKRYASGLLC